MDFEKQSGYKNLRRGNPAWGCKADGTGKSGNPNKGRPRKDCSITSLAKEMLDQPADERFLSPSDYGKTWRQAIAKALLVGALKLNSGIMKELLDRLEGKPVQLIGGETGGAITLRVVYDDRNRDRTSDNAAKGE